MAYGHNRKGDCTDIEMLAKVGASRAQMKGAVKNINPKGKTPISASVKKAADILKYTENKATIILISDGIETCNLDPCALGKRLEKDGIDFTAHVVGFDIVDKKTEDQLQCLASSTGGRYLSAASAGELSLALGETVGKKHVGLEPTKLHLEATILVDGPIIEAGLNWKVQQSGGGEIIYQSKDKGAVTHFLPPGVYDVFVHRPSDGLAGESRLLEVLPNTNQTVTIALDPEFEARVTPSTDTVKAGRELSVTWSGPNRKSDFITITKPDAPARSYTSYAYTSNGNPLKLTAPIVSGEYEVRYVLSRPYKVLARAPLKVSESIASVKGPKTAPGGSIVSIDWTGPATQSDFVTVTALDATPSDYLDYFYTKNAKSPHELTMPVMPGEYEIRYVFVGNVSSGASEHLVIARQKITIEHVGATLDGPARTKTGDIISVDWTGPSGSGDFITVTLPDAAAKSYTDYKYLKNGSPSSLRMPLNPGDYQLRIVQKGGRQGYKVLADKAIEITQVSASLSGPKKARVGSEIKVNWSGPAPQSGDFITVTAPDAPDRKYGDYAYTKNGTPAKISMPLNPGQYELRFVQNNAKVIARQPVTITDVSLALNAPTTAKGGETISVGFVGEALRGDWITIVRPSAGPRQYADYFYPINGSPQKLDMPEAAGIYEIRYVLKGNRVLARQVITLTK